MGSIGDAQEARAKDFVRRLGYGDVVVGEANIKNLLGNPPRAHRRFGEAGAAAPARTRRRTCAALCCSKVTESTGKPCRQHPPPIARWYRKTRHCCRIVSRLGDYFHRRV